MEFKYSTTLEKEFKKHIEYCREDYYAMIRDDVDIQLKKISKEIKKNEYFIKLTELSEKYYHDNYIRCANSTYYKLFKLFDNNNLKFRLNSIDSFHSELGRIGFSWKMESVELIIFVTIETDEEHPTYQCIQADITGFSLKETPPTLFEEKLPDWFTKTLVYN
jgi:hypothetical protein